MQCRTTELQPANFVRLLHWHQDIPQHTLVISAVLYMGRQFHKVELEDVRFKQTL